MSNRIAAFIAKKRGGLFCIRAMIYRNCTVCEKSLMAVKLIDYHIDRGSMKCVLCAKKDIT